MSFHPADVFFYSLPNKKTFLDIGCSVGDTLIVAKNLGYKLVHGIEINQEAVSIAQNKFKDDSSAKIFHGSADQIPLQDQVIQFAICCEVLEHVPESLRSKVVAEIFRVLSPGGRLVITVPFNGMFSILDPSNVRFRLPKIFDFFSRLIGGKNRDQGFANQKHGVVWHHHFSKAELEQMLTPYFNIISMRWRGGFLSPVLEWLAFPFQRFQLYQNPVFKLIKSIQNFDYRLQWGKFFSYNVLIVLEKRN